MNPGDTISRYRIEGPLGRGGMGVVYRAVDTKLDRPVALKFLPEDVTAEQDKLRFLREAQAAAAARHPNICPIYDIDEDGGRVFIAMALLEGETLRARIAHRKLSVPEVLDISRQIALGLECAHQLGIVHRDIKSGNVMVDEAGHASIMDFGLALRGDVTRLTQPGSSVGTPSYMSPEQAMGRAVDLRTDIWSLGVVMFEILTGTLPFRRDHGAAIIHAILADPVPPIETLRSDVPPELGRAVEKALAKRPEDRWQTAGELAAELKRIERVVFERSAGTPTESVAPPPDRVARAEVSGDRREDRRTQRKRSRDQRRQQQPWRRLATAALVLAIAGASYLYRTGGHRDAVLKPESAGSVRSVSATRQVAVLPFEVAPRDESVRNVADGLVEMLTSALAGIDTDAKIVTVPAPEILRRKIFSAAQARSIYGVDVAIAGSAAVAGEGGKAAITLRAVDATTGHQTGTESLVFDPARPQEARDQAVAAVMRLLKLPLTAAARPALRAGDSAAPEAYSSYLEGRGLLARYDLAGNLDRAIQLLERAVKADPNYALAWAGLGEAAWRKARVTGDKKWADRAVEDAERAVRLDGSLAIVHSVLGEVYGSAGRNEEAIGEFRKAIEIAPGNAEAPRELARVYKTLGRLAEAEAAYLQATKARPTDWYPHTELGVFYFERERYPEAEAELKTAAQLTPDNDIVYRDLGTVLTMQGRYGEAIEQFQHALKIQSTAATYMALGTAFFWQHRYQEAATAAETAIDLDSTRYLFWGNAGIYYKWAPGSQPKSVPALQRAVDLAQKFLETVPTDYEARANLAEYRARLGDAKGAIAELDRIPASIRSPFAARFALVYELSGRRAEAIQQILLNLKSAASLNQIRDDPDLAQLWNSPEIQQFARKAGMR